MAFIHATNTNIKLEYIFEYRNHIEIYYSVKRGMSCTIIHMHTDVFMDALSIQMYSWMVLVLQLFYFQYSHE